MIFSRIIFPSSIMVCPAILKPDAILSKNPPNGLLSTPLKQEVMASRILENIVEIIFGILVKALTMPSAMVFGKSSASFNPAHQSFIPFPRSLTYLTTFLIPLDSLNDANQFRTASATFSIAGTTAFRTSDMSNIDLNHSSNLTAASPMAAVTSKISIWK